MADKGTNVSPAIARKRITPAIRTVNKMTTRSFYFLTNPALPGIFFKVTGWSFLVKTGPPGGGIDGRDNKD
jgi:hypothetical protein